MTFTPIELEFARLATSGVDASVGPKTGHLVRLSTQQLFKMTTMGTWGVHFELVVEASAYAPLRHALREVWAFRATILVFEQPGVDLDSHGRASIAA